MTNTTKKEVNWSLIIILVSVVSIGIILLLGTIVQVPAGHRGVLLTWGAVTSSLEPGLHFITPIAQSVVSMETRTHKYQVDADSASKDLQSVTTTIALNFHIDPGMAADIYQNIGAEYQDRIIIPAIEESVKASTAKFTAEELISKRDELKDVVKEEIKNRLEGYNLIVETVNIVNFAFSDQFNKAIESKVTAEQESLTAQRLLEKVKYEAQQKVEAARGDAEAIDIINQQLLKSPQYINYLAVTKWDGILPLATGGAVPFIDIGATS